MNKICKIYLYETKSINISAVCSCQSCFTVYHLFSASLSAFLSFLSYSFSATQFTFPCVCFSNAFLSASFSTSYLAYLSTFISVLKKPKLFRRRLIWFTLPPPPTSFLSTFLNPLSVYFKDTAACASQSERGGGAK